MDLTAKEIDYLQRLLLTTPMEGGERLWELENGIPAFEINQLIDKGYLVKGETHDKVRVTDRCWQELDQKPAAPKE